MKERLSSSILTFSVILCVFTVPTNAMERSYSAPESGFSARLAIVAIPIFVIARHISDGLNTPDISFTNRERRVRGVFLVTNEIGNEQSVQEIRRRPARGNTGIGVSGLFNLELFLARANAGVTHWLIVDPAPEVQVFWREVIRAFAHSSDLSSVFAQLTQALLENSSHFFSLDFLRINGLIEPEDYRKWVVANLAIAKARIEGEMRDLPFTELRRLILEGVTLFPTDLADPDQVQRLVSYAKQNGFDIDTLYASNVFMHLPEEATTTFREQINLLRRLSGDRTLAYLVEALPKREGELARITGTPFQKIYDK